MIDIWILGGELMTNYKHILLAVDFSDAFDQVISKALKLQQQSQSKLTLIQVLCILRQ